MKRFLEWLMKDYDRWIGNDEGQPIFFIKHLLHFRGYRVDLHKMVRADNDYCFHTHPAQAVRLVLWGGYVEETPAVNLRTGRFTIGAYQRWSPGQFGRVRPEFCHRIHRLLEDASYSLWLRGPITHKVKLIGTGWGDRQGAEV